MKKKILSLSILIVMFLLSAGSKPVGSQAEKISPIPLMKPAGKSYIKNLEVNTPITSEKKNNKIFRVKKIDPQLKAHNLAKQFNLSVKEEKKVDDLYAVNGEAGTILVSENGGGFTFYKNNNTQDGVVPDKTKCIEIAKQYLTEKGLFSSDMKAIYTTDETSEFMDKNNKVIKKVTENITVYFDYKIDGIPVNSGGVSVKVGKNGLVEAVYENRKDLEEIGTSPVISQQEAVEYAKNGYGVYAGDKEYANTGYINSVKLVYLDNGPFSNMYTEYQPVYIISGTLDSKDAKEKFTIQVRGINPSAIEENNQLDSRKSITKKEFDCKEPNNISLFLKGNDDSKKNIKEIDLSDNTLQLEKKSKIMKHIEDILQNTNGAIIGYSSSTEAYVKMNDLTKENYVVEMNYNVPKKISFQYGDAKNSTIKEKDIYGNLAIDTKKIAITMNQDTKKSKVFIIGDNRTIMVDLEAIEDVQELINTINN